MFSPAANLAKDDLTTIGLIAAIEIVAARAALHGLEDGLSRRPRIHTSNDQITAEPIIGIDTLHFRLPVGAHEHIQPIDQKSSLVPTDIRWIEALAADVALTDRVIVIDDTVDTTGMAKFEHGVMEPRQTWDNRTPRSAGAYYSNAPCPLCHRARDAMRHFGHTTSRMPNFCLQAAGMSWTRSKMPLTHNLNAMDGRMLAQLPSTNANFTSCLSS
ncbi:hypothetical protein LMG18101_03299 [Ralstonia flaminis]|uniref:Uncharacterized protein n=4 Tax=Pseudomonadota TaxID=1224 RepID=A0ABN9KHW2_9RALS|nr:hypothetical protein R38712_03105 [Ralstonia pickettii]CAJ0817527.1 hypothetical protein LMG18101_03299 [Ralstonia sp. LMG 18101]CAJ0889877.1 hypothetical protein R77564_03412 [Ralstonia sp. LMG 32965]SCW89711.1 hypothetical protein SAMN02799637_03244 [Ralstonia sp. UNCCL144]